MPPVNGRRSGADRLAGVMRVVTDSERRARLGRRHGLAPGCRYPSPEAATAGLTVLHSTEPPTPYLSLWARVEQGNGGDGDRIERDEVERALYGDRSLVKQLAMRRTLFVFPRDLLPAALGSISVRVAAGERARLGKDLLAAGITDDPDRWLARAGDAILERVADGAELSATEVRTQVPEVAGTLVLSPGKKYEAKVHVVSRVLTLLGAEGRIVRARNASHWRVSKPQWTSMAAWLGEEPERLPEAEGYAELTRRWLWTFGPGTVDDLQWWLGSTKTAARAALAAVDAVEVALASGGSGWLLPDDLDEVEEPGPWVALLPTLDATIMGWKGRDWYLGPHRPSLFDTAGNAGTSAWVDGRCVGVWVQDEAGVVEVRLLEAVPASTRRALRDEAERLTGWLGGERVNSVYASTAMRDPGLTEPA